MAYTDYKYDIFLSYARSDNSGDRITNFKKNLQRHFLEETHKDLEIFFDDEKFTDIGKIDQLLRANVNNSYIFMFILSQNSYQSEWCKFEFNSFLEEVNSYQRIIVITLDDMKTPFPNIRCFPLETEFFRDTLSIKLLCEAIIKSLDRIKNFDRIIYFPQPKIQIAKGYYLKITQILKDQKYIVESMDDYNCSNKKSIENIMSDSSYYVQFFISADIDRKEKLQFYCAIENQFQSMKILYIYSEGLELDLKKKLVEGYTGDKNQLRDWIEKRKNNLDFIQIQHSTTSQEFQKEIKELLVEKKNNSKLEEKNIVNKKSNLYDSQENLIIAEEGVSSKWLNQLQKIVTESDDSPNFILYANKLATISNVSVIKS